MVYKDVVIKRDNRYDGSMSQFLCKIIGHKDFSPEVLRVRPWETPDLRATSIVDYREPNCLRCGDSLRDEQAA
jgi:hypothetical protein